MEYDGLLAAFERLSVTAVTQVSEVDTEIQADRTSQARRRSKSIADGKTPSKVSASAHRLQYHDCAHSGTRSRTSIIPRMILSPRSAPLSKH